MASPTSSDNSADDLDLPLPTVPEPPTQLQLLAEQRRAELLSLIAIRSTKPFNDVLARMVQASTGIGWEAFAKAHPDKFIHAMKDAAQLAGYQLNAPTVTVNVGPRDVATLSDAELMAELHAARQRRAAEPIVLDAETQADPPAGSDMPMGSPPAD